VQIVVTFPPQVDWRAMRAEPDARHIVQVQFRINARAMETAVTHVAEQDSANSLGGVSTNFVRELKIKVCTHIEAN